MISCKNKRDLLYLHVKSYEEYMAGSMIQANGMVEYEDVSPPWRLKVPLC